jgi:peptide deformylase
MIKNMFETMYASDGIGLAATQVDQHLQIVVMEVPDSGEYYQFILINRNTENSTDKHPSLCVSLPSFLVMVGLIKHNGCFLVRGLLFSVLRFFNINW